MPANVTLFIVGFRPSPSFLLSVSRCGRSSARHFIRGEKFDPTQHAEGDAKKKKKKGGVDDEGSYNEHKGAHTEWVKERSAQTGDEGFSRFTLLGLEMQEATHFVRQGDKSSRRLAMRGFCVILSGFGNKETVECRLIPPFLTKSRPLMPFSSSRGAFCAVLAIRSQAVCPALAVYPADRGRQRRCEIYEDGQRPLLRTSTQPKPKGHHTPVMRKKSMQDCVAYASCINCGGSSKGVRGYLWFLHGVGG